MRTARLLTISQHVLPGEGGVPAGGGTCWGCTCWGGVPVGGVPAGGVPARGCTCSERVYLPWGWGMYLLVGVPARGGVYLPVVSTCQWGYLPRCSPLWTEWQTGAKILSCPKLRLRAVNIIWHEHDKSILEKIKNTYFILLWTFVLLAFSFNFNPLTSLFQNENKNRFFCNFAERWPCFSDLGPMTLVLKPDKDIAIVYLHSKTIKFPDQAASLSTLGKYNVHIAKKRRFILKFFFRDSKFEPSHFLGTTYGFPYNGNSFTENRIKWQSR